jgi:hypothetical protein
MIGEDKRRAEPVHRSAVGFGQPSFAVVDAKRHHGGGRCLCAYGCFPEVTKRSAARLKAITSFVARSGLTGPTVRTIALRGFCLGPIMVAGGTPCTPKGGYDRAKDMLSPAQNVVRSMASGSDGLALPVEQIGAIGCRAADQGEPPALPARAPPIKPSLPGAG